MCLHLKAALGTKAFVIGNDYEQYILNILLRVWQWHYPDQIQGLIQRYQNLITCLIE